MPHSAQDLLFRKFSLLVTVFIFRPSPPITVCATVTFQILQPVALYCRRSRTCRKHDRLSYRNEIHLFNRAYTRQKCLASTFAPRVAMNLLVPNASVEWYSGTRAHDLVPIPRMMLSISWDCARLVHQGSGTRLIRGLQARRMQWHFRCDIRE